MRNIHIFTLVALIGVVLLGAIVVTRSPEVTDLDTPSTVPTSTPNNTLDVPVTMRTTNDMVTYHNETQGYLATPEGAGPFPALVLIHEWWGLNDNIKSLADDFAQQGYVALAVDLYDGAQADTPDEARTLAGAVRENVDNAFANLEAATVYLSELDTVNANRLASVGWCFGGQWAYEMAKNDIAVDASVMYYGRFMPEDDLTMMRADILGHFGEDDVSISIDDVRQFEAKLKTLEGDHAVFIYPNAGHAFANEDNVEAYNEEAATLAWDRTLEFLSRELK